MHVMSIDLPASMFFASLTISALVLRWTFIFDGTFVDKCMIDGGALVLVWLVCLPTDGPLFVAGRCLVLLLLLGMLYGNGDRLSEN